MASPKQSELARLGRQQILDYLHNRDWVASNAILRMVGGSKQALTARLIGMRRANEIESREINGSMQYRALVRKTAEKMPINEVALQAMHAAKKAMLADPAEHPKPKGPWHTIHLSADRPPIPNQGGQGAVRRSVAVGSSAGLCTVHL